MEALAEEAQALLAAVSQFIGAPTPAALHALRRLQPQLLRALEPPRPRAEDRERVRARTSGVAGLEEADGAVALQLSDSLHINELLAARLVAAVPKQLGGDGLARLQLAAETYYEARRDIVGALHRLLLHTAAGQLQHEQCEDEFWDFMKALLSEPVDGKTVLQRLAPLVQSGAARCKRLLQHDAAGAAMPGVAREVPCLGSLTEQARVEGEEVALLAECLFFAASLRERVERAEVAAMLAALDDLTNARSSVAAARDSPHAVAVLMALLAALERNKITAADCSALRDSATFQDDKHDALSALLRLALGLCSPASGDALLQKACDEGAFGFLIDIVRSPIFQAGTPEWPDVYVVTAHSLVTCFLEDERGRNQVKRLREEKHAAFPQLLHVLAALYEQGSEDLPLQFDALWQFADYAIEEYLLQRSPATLMAILQLMLSMPPSESLNVWVRLHSATPGVNAPGDLICGAMSGYCNLFAGEDVGAAFGRPRPLFRDDSAMQIRELDMPAEDVDALVAYLRLLQQLMETAPPELSVQRVQQLEGKCLEGQSIMRLFFTLFDFPVPPKLKAALCNVVGAFATEMASAVKIWSYLETAAVIQKPVDAAAFPQDPQLYASAARTDIVYQLNEVEARAETYPETLAFISLVNKLLDLCESSNCGPATDAGAASSYVFQFVRDTVFVNLDRRTYKDISEKWQLTEACLQHFKLLIQLAQNTPASVAAQALRAPGAELLREFESEGPVLRGILNLLHGGAQRLSDERVQPHGWAVESAISQALNVLLAAYGAGTADAAGRHASRLDVLLLRDRRHLNDLFSYVHYEHDAALQTSAVRIVHTMAMRNERLPAALDLATSQRLKAGIDAALAQGLAEFRSLSGTAHAVLRLLLDTLPQPATPNLGHLLLGFEATPEGGGLAFRDSGAHACLPQLLDAAATPEPGDDVPDILLRERIFEVLYTLAADRRTHLSAVAYINGKLALAELVERDGAPPASPAALTALRHQRCWLLRLAAVVLHHPAPFGASAEGNAAALLRALFSGDADGATELRLLRLLSFAVAQTSTPPALDPADAQVLDALGLSGALSTDALLESAGIRMHTERGEAAVNLVALDALLHQRVAEQQQRQQPPHPAFYEAVLRYALRLNEWRAERAASLNLLQAWSQLVCLAVAEHCQRDAPGAAAVLVAVLTATARLLPDVDDKRAVLLLPVCQVVLAQLHAQANAGGALSPSVCHDILRCLLCGLQRSDREATPHYVRALLAYLQLCRPPLWAQSPAVLRARLPAAAAGFCAFSGEARLELDAGNLAVFRNEGGALMSLLARQAAGGSEPALALVQAVLSLAEGAGAVFESSLFASRLPKEVAAALERTSPSALLQQSAGATLAAVDAQLSFLLSVACDTPGGPAHLVACGVIPHLSGCRLIGALLEERGGQRAAARDRLLLPVLRLLTALLQLLPDSRELDVQATAFVQAHHDVLLRALSARTAESDAAQLREALLAARLLCRLCARDSGAELLRFRDALERLCWELFDADFGGAQSEPRSELASAGWLVQGTLAGYLRTLLSGGRAALPVAAAAAGAYAGVRAGPPTLLLVSRLLQTSSLAFTRVLGARVKQLARLRDTPGSDAAHELAQLDADARVLLNTLENALQIVHASLATAQLKPREIEQLARELAPVLGELARVSLASDWDRDLGFLSLLLRRLAPPLGL